MKRGRKSANELATRPVALVFERKLPDPPPSLNPEEGEVWKTVIASAVGDMTGPEAYPLLMEFCKVVVNCRVIGVEMRRFDPKWAVDEEGLRRWNTLLLMQDRVQGRLSSLATKLRISPQTRTHKNRAATIFENHPDPNMPRPWDPLD